MQQGTRVQQKTRFGGIDRFNVAKYMKITLLTLDKSAFRRNSNKRR